MEPFKVVVFTVSDRHYAIASSSIKEVNDVEGNIKKVLYDKGGALSGIMSYEGDMISVLHTAKLLDHEDAEDNHILVCKDKNMDRAVGLITDTIVGMEVLDKEKIKHSQDEAAYTFGFLKEGEGDKERVVTFLDLSKFLEYVMGRVAASGVTGTEAI